MCLRSIRLAGIGSLVMVAGVLPVSGTTARAHGSAQRSATRCAKRNPVHGVLRYSEVDLPTSLNPFGAGSLSISLFDDLFRYGPTGKVYAMMAREMPTLKNGGIRDGGKTIVIHIKPGLRWSNDTEITAADVKFGWEIDMDPATGPLCVGTCDSVRSISTPDRYTDVLHMRRVFGGILTPPWPLANGWQVWPVRWPHAWNGDPHAAALKLSQDPAYNFLSPSYPTSGPYQVARVVSDHEVDLRPMKYYDDMTCGGYIKTIRDIGFANDLSGLSAMQAAAGSGHLDLGIGYQPSQIGSLQRLHGVYTVHAPPSFDFDHLEFNLDRTYDGVSNPLSSTNVRLALALALDRPTVIKDALGVPMKEARELVAWTPWVNSPLLRQPFADPLLTGQWDPIARKYVSDTGRGQALADARTLLARTPWKHGFTLDFLRGPAPYHAVIVRDLATLWGRLGVKLRDHQTTPGYLFGTWANGGVLVHGAFQVTSFSWTGGTDPDPLKSLLESRYVARDHPSRALDADQNFAGIRDSVIDREFERGEGSFNHSVRTSAFYRVQARLNQKAYWVPLSYRPDVSTTTPRIEGYRTNPVGGGEAMDAYLWKVK
jgi:peptide/nickel transport system substrate-binding protein